MKVLVVIPCRIGSSRLPRKPLLKIGSKSLIQHVFEGVSQSKSIDKIIIATDSTEIYDTVKEFGAEVRMTSVDHQTGTDRICEVISTESDYDIILNIQGDEPLVNGEMVDNLIEPLKDSDINVSTLKKRIDSIEEYNNPNIVKVIVDKNKNALYFSRSIIPFPRNKERFSPYRHVGMYGFKKEFLLLYQNMKMTDLEYTESLEQLRILENGYKIAVREIETETVDVNVEEDLILAEEALKKCGRLK